MRVAMMRSLMCGENWKRSLKNWRTEWNNKRREVVVKATINCAVCCVLVIATEWKQMVYFALLQSQVIWIRLDLTFLFLSHSLILLILHWHCVLCVSDSDQSAHTPHNRPFHLSFSGHSSKRFKFHSIEFVHFFSLLVQEKHKIQNVQKKNWELNSQHRK